ncbi:MULTISPECIES: hypothetical protein [unclassified Streptomyces]|uniref:hypothetical protein n=1 Tax=unclassified Streptomyces TaxID=2593676 RepID=UPI000700C1A7|nr:MULTISPECIES: hypothetical protein [unclassified Streptomyces]KQX59379.1 hypothetical protein ASD33_03610 [Streptomyces sp. Root1304]KRB00640.1 hypothetical protein ASE09_03610 [Streptomyces sp. Root66D1]
MTNSLRPSASGAPAPTAAASGPGDEADPRWWVPPLAATLLSPLLSLMAVAAMDMLTALPVLLISGFLLPFAAVVPSWCLARTRRRRQARINLAVVACGLAAGYPGLLIGVGSTVFFVMLLTGNVHS